VGIAVRILLWGVLLAVAVAALSLAAFGLFRVFLAGNPHFTLEYIDVEVTPAISKRQVCDIVAEMGIREYQTNLLTIDLETVRRRLEKEVVISRAVVIRQIPDTLVISLYERRPVAVLHCRPRRLIDEHGIVLPWWQTGDAGLLPEITGIRTPLTLRPGTKTTDEALRGALAFLEKIGARPEGVLYDVATIQLDYYLPSLRVYLRQRDTFRKGAVLIVPVKGMDAALDRLRDIATLRSKAEQTTGFIDATYERNLPVLP